MDRSACRKLFLAVILALFILALLCPAALAQRWTGKVVRVAAQRIAITVDQPTSPPVGARVEVFDVQDAQRKLPKCTGSVTAVQGREIEALVGPCPKPVGRGDPVVITAQAQGQKPPESTVDCSRLTGTLECQFTYVLAMDEVKVQVKSSGSIPFSATGSAPYPLRGQGTMSTATTGQGQMSRLMGPSTGTFTLKGACQGNTVTFIITSVRTQTGVWVGSNPDGEVRVGPGTHGGGGSQTVTLPLRQGAKATVPISQGGGSGQSVYILHIHSR